MTTEEKIMTYLFFAALLFITPFCMLFNLILGPVMPRTWRINKY